jgi:sulfide:quinone oxidoreductase
VARLLDDHAIAFHGGVRPVAADAGELELDDGTRIPADAIVALPGLRGRPIEGLPQDAQGFVAVDEHGAVDGLDGGLRRRRRDDLPAQAGRPGGPAGRRRGRGDPRRPRRSAHAAALRGVLRGVLYTDREPAYLRAPARGEAAAPRSWSMWWPPSKIAGRHLAPYLTVRAGAPRAPEARPEIGLVPVSIDVRAVASAIAGEVPPG